jgi:glycosyltransferase involved in cell wall biosynthesis
MTILHLRNSDIFGSPERLIIGQCRHLPEFRFVCASFVRHRQTNRFLEECVRQGLIAEPCRESFPGDWRVIPQIQRIIRRHQVKLIVTHDYKADFFGYFAAQKCHIPQVGYFHGITAEDLKVKLYNAIDRFMLRRLPCVITISTLTRRLLTERSIKAEKIYVVPNAVPSDSLLDTRQDRSGRKNRIDVIAAGRFSYEKGFDILLRAVAAIKDKAPPFTLHLYGQGPEEEKLRRLTRALGLDDIVSFRGFVDNILPILSQMDLLVLSSRSEGMPVIILEAWSQQVGVLAMAVGGVPELIADGENGLLVPREDVRRLAEKLLWALQHPDEVNRFGMKGFELVKEKYTFESQAKLLRKIYTEIIGVE